MATQQTPVETLAWITDALASNKTIYVATATPYHQDHAKSRATV